MPIVLPDILKDCLLILAHDKSGHNGFRRTYGSLKNRFHWKGLKKSIHLHCSRCQVCAKHNIKTQQLRTEHFSSPPQPMEFIAPGIEQGQQIRTNSHMHAYRVHILHTTQVKESRRCDKCLHQPHLLSLWTI